jgi:hypothetical protein
MSEKEFLIAALNSFAEAGIYTQEKLEKVIDEFLEEHHKTYCEIEFLTKEDEMKFYKEMEDKIGLEYK